MKVALVHDDLVQWGGAEKVLLEISGMFPDAPIYTSVYNTDNSILAGKLKNKVIITSFLQNIPGWKNLYKPMLPLYGLAFEQFNFDQYDLVISQTTRFAKAIITKPRTRHICYCHTPARFLWNLPSDKTSGLLSPLFNLQRIYDRIINSRVDVWIAGSYNCAQRLKKIYHINSEVLQPFVDDSLKSYADSCGSDFYLIIARLNEYKKVQLAVDAFNKNGKPLKVIGNGPLLNFLKSNARSNIEFYSNISDHLLSLMLASASALIITAEEDFGMSALEAQSFGKGVIAFGRGGVRETVLEGKTGIFFASQTAAGLDDAVTRFEGLRIDPNDCIQNAARFSRQTFRSKLVRLIEKYTV